MVTKKARNPEITRLRILEAAADRFAARGPGGARVDVIAAAAGINKRMLYHYFHDKQGLFDAVVAHRLGRLVDSGRLQAQRIELNEVDARLLIWAAAEGRLPAELVLGLRRMVAGARQQGAAHGMPESTDTGILVLLHLAVSLLLGLLPDLVNRVLADDPQADVSADVLAFADALWEPAAIVARGEGRPPRPRVRMLPDVRPL